MVVFSGGFPGGSVGKESACNVGDLGSSPGSGRSPGEGNGNPLQYSCLENFIDRVKEETQNRLPLESRTLSWAQLWTWSSMPSIYGNDTPTGKPGPLDGRAPGLVPRLSVT